MSPEPRTFTTIHPAREVYTVNVVKSDGELWIVRLVPSRWEGWVYDAYLHLRNEDDDADDEIHFVELFATGKENPEPGDYARAALACYSAETGHEMPAEERTTPNVTAPGGVS